MKKILIALDYDPTALKVAEVGFKLAKSMHASVTLLHVILDPASYTLNDHITILGFSSHLNSSTILLQKDGGTEEIARQFLENSKLHLGDPKIHTLIREGDLAESIIKAATDLQADIIVMGSHSRKWNENLALENVTEKTLNQSNFPLLIVPVKNHNQ